MMKRSRDVDVDEVGGVGVGDDSPVVVSRVDDEGETLESVPAALPSLGDVQASVLRLLASRAADSSGISFLSLCTLVNVSSSSDTSVALRSALSVNPRVRIDVATGNFHYRTRYAARDAVELARLITAQGETPIPVPDLIDLFPSAAAELDALVRAGEVIRVASDQPLPDVIYSRDLIAATRIRLSGTFAVTAGSAIVRTTADLTNELFRNDVLIIDSHPFRVSSQAIPAPFRSGGGGGGGGGVSMIGGGSASASSASVPIPPTSISLTNPINNGDEEVDDDSDMSGTGAGTGVVEASGDNARMGGGGGGGGSGGGDGKGGPSSGIYYVTIGNSVRKTGGNFSAADTAPHELRATFTYAHPFTARSLPLDRVWNGATASGLTAYRLGAPGDLRALWREVVTHEAVARSAGATAAAAAAAAVETAEMATGTGTSSSASAAPPLAALSLLGGAASFRDTPDFPTSHRSLRDAMKKAANEERSRGGGGGGIGLETYMTPGTLEASAPIPTRAPRDPAERALLRRSKPRNVSVRELQIVGADHLAPGVREAVQKAQFSALRKKFVASHTNNKDQ